MSRPPWMRGSLNAVWIRLNVPCGTKRAQSAIICTETASNRATLLECGLEI